MRRRNPPVQIPAASPDDLQKARIALGDKPQTPMERIEEDKKFLAEIPKQIKSADDLKRTIWDQARDMLKQKDEKKRRDTFFGSADDDDGTPEIIYSLEECDYLPGDENGDEEDPNETPQPTAGANGAPPAKKKAVDLYPDAKVHFQTYQFDPGLKRAGVTLARSLPDHIWEALKHQAMVGPAAISSQQSTWGQTTTRKKLTEAIAGNDDQDVKDKNLGFGLEPGYKSINATSRDVTPDNAWVFSDERLRDFVVRLMDDAKIAIYEKDPDNPTGVAQLFKRALKAWFNLYFYYRIHTSDLSFSEMEGLQVPKGLWTLGSDNTDIAARKMHRKRLLRDGIALYGTPADWKPLDPDSIARSKNLFPLFERIRHQVVKPADSSTSKHASGMTSEQKAKK